jgi:hypothetical protein
LRKILIIVSVLLILTTPVLAASGIKLLIDGQPVNADLIIKNGHVYVPLRFVSEHFGYIVNWDDATETASIDTFKKAVEVPQINSDNKYYIDQINYLITELNRSKNLLYTLANDKFNFDISTARKTTDQNIETLKAAFKETSQNYGGVTYEDELQQEIAKEEAKYQEWLAEYEKYKQKTLKMYDELASVIDKTIQEGREIIKQVESQNLTVDEIKALYNDFKKRAKEYIM